MKVIVEDNENEGLAAYLGNPIAVWCMNYIYTGKLVGINDTCIKLEDAAIVYETGSFSDSGWKDAQALPGGVVYVQISAIESFGDVK